MSPPAAAVAAAAANGHASAKAPSNKPAQDTPDHKTSEDPRTNSVQQAVAQHPYGGAANLRDIYTNQGKSRTSTSSARPSGFCFPSALVIAVVDCHGGLARSGILLMLGRRFPSADAMCD